MWKFIIALLRLRKCTLLNALFRSAIWEVDGIVNWLFQKLLKVPNYDVVSYLRDGITGALVCDTKVCILLDTSAESIFFSVVR